MERNIKVAVIGGTGKAGRYLVKNLVEQDYSVKALTRNPKKPENENSQIETLIGDVTNYENVQSLIKDCDVLISTLGQSKGEAPVFSLATKNIVKAMNTLHKERYIVLTGLTLDTQHDKKSVRTRMKTLLMKMLFGKIIQDKGTEYKILSESNINWTIVRVPFIELSDNRSVAEVSMEDCRGSKINSTDLAFILIDQITCNDFLRKAPFVWSTENRLQSKP